MGILFNKSVVYYSMNSAGPGLVSGIFYRGSSCLGIQFNDVNKDYCRRFPKETAIQGLILGCGCLLVLSFETFLY